MQIQEYVQKLMQYQWKVANEWSAGAQVDAIGRVRCGSHVKLILGLNLKPKGGG